MRLFRPSKKILEKICTNDKLVTSYTTLPSRSSMEALEETISTSVIGLFYQIAEYYNWALDIQKSMSTQKVGEVFGEALTNSIAHGSKNKYPVTYGLFMGDEGICYGFQDGGNFFKREYIKKKFEAKGHPGEFDEGLKTFAGARAGIGFIFESSDMIEVDTKEGVLYCVQFKESLKKL